ncbi:MAG: hypothetical protein ACK5N0_05755 [Synechococcaceae cyanobacterium]
MKPWRDDQLSPLLAGGINAQEWGIQAFAGRDVGLRDARDPGIFHAAQEAGVVVMTKKRDCIRLLDEQALRRRRSGMPSTAGSMLKAQ